MTLPADLVDEVARRLTVSGYKTSTEFIKAAIREKLAAPSSDSEQPASSVGTVTTSSEVEGESSPNHRRSPRPESGSEGAAADKPLSRDSAADAPERVHATRDVPAGGRESGELPGTTSVPSAVPPASESNRVGASANPAREISTWTCPECHVTMPLKERRDHKATHTTRGDRDSGPATATAAHSTAETSSSPATPATIAARPIVPVQRRVQVNTDTVVDRVKTFARGQRFRDGDFVDAKARREYLAAVVKAAHADQHFTITDEESLELLIAYAARDPAIERALEPPASLSMPTPTNKGGARGRK